MFIRTATELSNMTWDQLLNHHRLCCRMAAEVLSRLTPDEQAYVSQVEAEITRRKKDVNLSHYNQ